MHSLPFNVIIVGDAVPPKFKPCRVSGVERWTSPPLPASPTLPEYGFGLDLRSTGLSKCTNENAGTEELDDKDEDD